MADDNVREIVLATQEITVNIKGITYDAILIPQQDLVKVDFSKFPEDDPLRRVLNVEKLSTLDIHPIDLIKSGEIYHLTQAAAKRLLESL